MSISARLLASGALVGLLTGCAAGPAGLAMTGASMLASALTGGAGGAGGAGPRRLTIDPNKALSEQLAQVQRGASPACRAILAKMEAGGGAAGTPAELPVQPAGGEAPPPTAETPEAAPGESQEKGSGQATSEGRRPASADPTAGAPLDASGPDCAVRPLCLAGAEAPIPMTVCTRRTAERRRLAHLSPAPMTLPEDPIEEVAPRRDALPDSSAAPAATPPAEADDAWRWATPPKS